MQRSQQKRRPASVPRRRHMVAQPGLLVGSLAGQSVRCAAAYSAATNFGTHIAHAPSTRSRISSRSNSFEPHMQPVKAHVGFARQ